MILALLILPLVLAHGSRRKYPPNETAGDIIKETSWVEETDKSGPVDMDIYFDRAVFLTLDPEEAQPLTPGVFITRRLILTSFNPFRKAYNEGAPFPKIIILLGRKLTEPGANNSHNKITIEAVCARQVVPSPEEDLTLNKRWHGTDQTHSPLHDLMVLRTDEDLKFYHPDPSKYSFDRYPAYKIDFIPTGPIVTYVASLQDELDRDLKFASLGFTSKKHILKSRVLSSRNYEEDDNVLEDCNEWFPKVWGYFICLLNVDHYEGVGSGALLIYENKLFGVGSFLLKKNNQSLLVFTDVRPYYNIIFRTCLGKLLPHDNYEWATPYGEPNEEPPTTKPTATTTDATDTTTIPPGPKVISESTIL